MLLLPYLKERRKMDVRFGKRLQEELRAAGKSWQEAYPEAVGRTLFDQVGSKDHTVTVVLPPEHLDRLASRALVRIKSRSEADDGDGRQYLGLVVQGPFAEPDGLRADAPVIVTTTVRGTLFLPRYHGRLQVRILGEELADGSISPPRFRPLPNSPVYPLSDEETAEKLRLAGDVRLGLALGYDHLPVGLSSQRKDVFPRHTAILGTTGAGKSVTVASLVGGLSRSEVAVVVFDTEGEYTHLMQPTRDERMCQALNKLGLEPQGLERVDLYHLSGRDTTHPDYPRRYAFGLDFSQLSPYAVMEILGLNEAQQERFLRAYDLAKQLLKALKVYPATPAEEGDWLDLDELESGYPRLTLPILYDVVSACAQLIADDEVYPFTSPLLERQREFILDVLQRRLPTFPRNPWSWRKVQGALGGLLRLGIFDAGWQLDYERMTQPGQVTMVDLSGTDSRQVNNLVIAQLLLGLRRQQEVNYGASIQGEPARKVVIVIEEAHEFLSASRVGKMEVLFDQLTRIARRGRKRWLGLVFVSQSPQDLPDEVLGLVNNFILHKLNNADVIARLKRAIGGLDEGLWERLPDLEPGTAIVKAGSLAQPLLVAMDPSPHQLLLVE
jgi:uncharacterized protein